MVGHVWGNANHPLAIGLRYDDDVGVERPSRRIEVTSTGAEGLQQRPPPTRDLAYEHSYSSAIINFTHTFTQLEERPVEGSERSNADFVHGRLVPKTIYLPSAGTRRLLEPLTVEDGTEIERVTFPEHAALRLYRVQRPDVEVLVMSWGYEDDYLAEFVASARPISDDPELLVDVERAEYAAWTRIRERGYGRD